MFEGRTDFALTLQRVERGCALHFIRYDYDEVGDRVPRLDRLMLDVRLPFESHEVTAFSPGGELVARGESAGRGVVRVTLRKIPLYGIVLISAGSSEDTQTAHTSLSSSTASDVAGPRAAPAEASLSGEAIAYRNGMP